MIKKPLIRKFAFKNSIVFCCCNICKNESMWFISLKCDSPLMTADWLWNRLKCMDKEVNEHTVSHAYLDMNLSCAVHWHPILGSGISKWTLVSMVHCSLWTKQRKMKKNKSCSTRLKSKSRLDVWRDTFNTFARFFHLRKMCVLPPFFISFHTIPAIELVCVTSKWNKNTIWCNINRWHAYFIQILSVFKRMQMRNRSGFYEFISLWLVHWLDHKYRINLNVCMILWIFMSNSRTGTSIFDTHRLGNNLLAESDRSGWRSTNLAFS